LILQEDTYKHRGKRRALVKTIHGKGIESEATLKAVGNVPRHFFFDPAFLEHAYQDKAFPIGEGQTISQPYTVAFQTQLLEIIPEDKVLEIGTGSGYQACILIELGAKVYSIEYNRILYDRTRKFLPKMGYHPTLHFGDGTKGWPTQAPFDKILVTAGAPSIPNELIKQLKVGGMMVIPVGSKHRQTMIRLTKQTDQKILKEDFNYFAFVPLRGEKGWN
jgi:protein-L-isoaspartate(D-aspartate) O-methyltransferase